MGWHVMHHGHRRWTRRASRLLSQLLWRQGKHHGCGHPLPHTCPSNMVSSPNANFLLGPGQFSPLGKVGCGERNPGVGAFSLRSAGVPSEVPSVQAQHTWTSPLSERLAAPSMQPPCQPHQRRGGIQAVGLQTKPGSCCWSGISGEGMISTTINASDYLIRGKMRSPGGGPHTQKRNNSCPRWL